MTPDYTDLIASIRWHMQQVEFISQVDIRNDVWSHLWAAQKAAERAQEVIADHAKNTSKDTQQADRA